MKTKFLISMVFTIIVAGLFFLEQSIAKSNHVSLHSPDSHISMDAEILGILITLNKNEISAANLALKKTDIVSIKEHAQMLKKDHKKNLDDTLKLSIKMALPTKESAEERALKEAGQIEMKHLSSLKDKKFDEFYIDAMIKDHKQAIKMLDDNLLKNVTHSTLRTFLLATKTYLISHLKQAQKIRFDRFIKSA